MSCFLLPHNEAMKPYGYFSISVDTLMRHIGPVALYAASSLGSRNSGERERALLMIALFSTVHSFPLIISLFQTSPVAASGESHAQTHQCFINMLSYFLTVGESCDKFCSLSQAILANCLNTMGESKWFGAILC